MKWRDSGVPIIEPPIVKGSNKIVENGTTAWRCAICGYVHRGSDPPDFCPVCGAGSTDFEPEDGSYTVIETEQDRKYYRFVFRDNRMVGSVLVGDTSISGTVKKAIENQSDFSEILSAGATARTIGEQLI